MIDPPAPTFAARLRRRLLGAPRDLHDRRLFHRLSLVPFLAWVGLGADGLSSSAYGPEEAFRSLGEHRYLAVLLAAIMAGTVLLISAAYRRIIEEFPTGGGGYVVASRLLGERAGLVSGSALVVDYVLTIAISLAAAGDALFSLLPVATAGLRLPVVIGLVALLVVLNLRGVRESVLALLPVFLVFLLSHAVLIGAGVVGHLPELGATIRETGEGFSRGAATIGWGGMLLVLVRAYSLGGGTYTGIEAVSNGLPIMREPKPETGKRTMVYMGLSLAITASGLLACYLLWRLEPIEGRTLNAVLADRVMGGWPLGGALVAITLVAEALLLVVAAQAGFLDGPRVLANMALDSWVPHRLAALSDRLTTQNGIVLMGVAALGAIIYTRGDVGHLVVLYAINVFLTFSLSMAAMSRLWWRRSGEAGRARRLALFGTTLALCLTILVITVLEKFGAGGWLTLAVTSLVAAICALVRRHYRRAEANVDRLYRELESVPGLEEAAAPSGERVEAPLDRRAPTAVVLVERFGGVGIHTVLNLLRTFPGHFGNLVFVSIGVIDSGDFKGGDTLEELRRQSEDTVARYAALARRLGVAATGRTAVGTEVVAEAERLCLEARREFAGVVVVAGKLVFEVERWWHALLHAGTARALQRRLQWAGVPMLTLPIRVGEHPAA
ncbi:MAG: APC family permease [Gemmatimonadales bacterium]